MCEFISWVERRGKVHFLTGKQIFSKEGQGKLKKRGVSPDDYGGHGTIRKWYGIDSGDGIDKECTDFSAPANFPDSIATAIKKGKFKGFPFPTRLLIALLDKDYKAKIDLLDKDYKAKRALLDKDYWAKRAPLDKDYWAKIAPLDKDYWAKIALLDKDYWAKRALLDKDYWDLFANPDNRVEAWK